MDHFAGVNANEGIRDGWDSTFTAEQWTGGALNGLNTEALRVEKAKDTRGATPLPGGTIWFCDHKWTADVRRSYNTQDGQTDFVDVSLAGTTTYVHTFNARTRKTVVGWPKPTTNVRGENRGWPEKHVERRRLRV